MLYVRQIAKRVLPQRIVNWIWRRLNPATVKTPLTHILRAAVPKFGPGPERVFDYEKRLWATGDSTYANQLAREVRVAFPGSPARIQGSVAIARWDLFLGRPAAALDRVETLRAYDAELQSEIDLLRVDCLLELGDARRALTVLSMMAGRSTNDHSLLLRTGKARALLTTIPQHGSGPIVESLNRIYKNAELALIRRANVAQPVGIDNLACDVGTLNPPRPLPLVSVIVVIPDSFPDRGCDLSSLLAQSWNNLQIIVVGRANLRRQLSKTNQDHLEDERIVVVEVDKATDHPVARGATEALGKLITSHQFGSWAHPQRVESQVMGLLSDTDKRGCLSFHLTVNSDLQPCFLGGVPGKELVGPDPLSVMINAAGLSANQVASEYDRFVGGLSSLWGQTNLPNDVIVVKEGTPLTLNLGEAPSALMATARLSK